MNELAQGYTLRHPTMADLSNVVKLVDIVCDAIGDAGVSISVDEMERYWSSDASDLNADFWVVESPDGEIVGYEEFENRFEHCVIAGDGYVHPAHHNKGIGTALVSQLVDRAKLEVPLAPPHYRVFVRNGFGANEVNAFEMHTGLGFTVSRYHWRMSIDLTELPNEQPLPEGLRFEPFDVANHDEKLWAAHHEAFKDHWGHVTRPYEYWVEHIRGFAEFDPDLWLVVWDGDEIAGYSLNRRKCDIGWVGTLGVRRKWRKRGLGYALLVNSFRVLFEAGLNVVSLTVDSKNPSGATRLYERAGMHIANEYIVVDKTLREGEEPTDG